MRPIYKIANEIEKDWKKVNYAARPYLDAMKEITLITDSYYMDSAKSIVLYFLSNANSWRGEVARKVKKELRGLANN